MVKAAYQNTQAPNQYQRRREVTLTPLIEGKIRYSKLLMSRNTEAVRGELRKRYIVFRKSTGWRDMIKLLKATRRVQIIKYHVRYFHPLTTYNNFSVICMNQLLINKCLLTID